MSDPKKDANGGHGGQPDPGTSRADYLFGGFLLLAVFAFLAIPLTTGHIALLQMRYIQLLGFALVSLMVAFILFVLVRGSSARLTSNSKAGLAIEAGGPIAGAFIMFWLLTRAVPQPTGLTIAMFKLGADNTRVQLGQGDGSTQVEVGSDVISRVTTTTGIASFPVLSADQTWLLRILNDGFRLKGVEPAKCIDKNNVVEISSDCRLLSATMEPVPDCLATRTFSAVSVGATTLKAALDSLLEGARVAGFSRAGIADIDETAKPVDWGQPVVDERRFTKPAAFCEHVRMLQSALQKATSRANLRLVYSCTEIRVYGSPAQGASPWPGGFQECVDQPR